MLASSDFGFPTGIVHGPTAGDSAPICGKRMLTVLQQTNKPLVHIVIAPRSDGESSFDDILSAMQHKEAAGLYLGSFSLIPVLQTFRDLGTGLEPDRTVNIITAAAKNRLTTAAPKGFVQVPRGLRPCVPVDWLTRGFVFAPGKCLSDDSTEQ